MTRLKLQSPPTLARNLLVWAAAALSWAGGSPLAAQPGGHPLGPLPERVKALKVAFITQRVQLTEAEAQRFWPVYNAREDELAALKRERRNALFEFRANFDDMTDEQVAAATDQYVQWQQREADINSRYHAQFKSILAPRKLAMFYKAEIDFKREMLRRVGEWRQGQPPPPPGTAPGQGGGRWRQW
jgi:Spy/CpxP family protein refolding chaperone